MKKNPRAYTLSAVLIFVTVFSILIVGIVGYLSRHIKTSSTYQKKTTALGIAEAGVNYYLWHLSHQPEDYCDGQTCQGEPPYGPYEHEYKDNQGNVVGRFILKITPPTEYGTDTTIESEAFTNSGETKKIKAKIGIPSFAQYSFITNSEVWFGVGETSVGPLHSNIGVRMDGTNNGPVYAANETFIPSSNIGGDRRTSQPGVYGIGGPKELWIFPVPAVDFNRITVDLADLKTKAQDDGIYLSGSGKKGYYLHLNSNNNIDAYKVTAENDSGITKTFYQTYAAPANGILFAEDNIYVDGVWNSEITIAAAKFPELASSYKSITITNNLTYVNKDGSNKIGLIAQNNVLVPAYSPQYLEIDAAMIAEKGYVRRPYIAGNLREKITVYGSISSNLQWTWSWGSDPTNIVSGYKQTEQIYDKNLTYYPPPSFPTTGSYAIFSWEEL